MAVHARRYGHGDTDKAVRTWRYMQHARRYGHGGTDKTVQTRRYGRGGTDEAVEVRTRWYGQGVRRTDEAVRRGGSDEAIRTRRYGRGGTDEAVEIRTRRLTHAKGSSVKAVSSGRLGVSSASCPERSFANIW